MWIEGLPTGLEGQLEVSPPCPVLGEPFYVRVILKNNSEEPINLPDSYVFSKFFSRASYLLDILSPHLSGYVRDTTYAVSGSGLIIAPESLDKTPNLPLLPKTTRVLLLDEYRLFPRDDENQEQWVKFLNDPDVKIRFTFFNEEDNVKGSLITPIQFKSLPDVFLNLAKEENRILKEHTQSMNEKDVYPFILTKGVLINAQNRAACVLLPAEQRISFEKRYPPGTSRMKLHFLILKQEILESDYQSDKIEELLYWLWTLPEIERQYFVLSLLWTFDKDGENLKTKPNIIETIVRMYPENYNSTLHKNRKTLYETLKNKSPHKNNISPLEEIINRPLPSYAGQGNEARGFFLPFTDWSISDEKMRLVTFFENNLTFETENAKEFIVPFEKLSEKEKKYVQALLKNQ
jgi:hypothetical protein